MRNLLLITVLTLLCGCRDTGSVEPTSGDDHLRSLFPDILAYQGVPAEAEDWTFMPMADQGAWFGFGLPQGEPNAQGSGFTGPFSMADGRWISLRFVTLTLGPARGLVTTGYPGLLRQRYLVDDHEVVQELWFHDSRTALIRTVIQVGGDEGLSYRPAWNGTVFPEAGTLIPTDDGMLLVTPDSTRWRVTPGMQPQTTWAEGHDYRIETGEPFLIAPGDSMTLDLAITMTLAGDPEPDPHAALATVEKSRRVNATQWQQYLKPVVDMDSKSDTTNILAVKAVQTLVNNWRAPAGRMQHGGLFPSSNVWYFNGFWAWDSWKHAVGLVHFAPQIASDQMRLMFDHQDSTGMVADVVYLDPGEDNWRDTKPPLAGWALEKIYGKTQDLDLVRDLFPSVLAFHEFWYRHRDHDQDGLCEYGSTDGTIVAARWESGMDNAVRFDNTTMLQNGPHSWSMNQESVDLNSYLYRDKRALAFLAEELGYNGSSAKLANEADALRDIIRATMYNKDTGWFYDTDIETGAIMPVQGPEGWIPLWAGVATDEQAATVRTTLLDTMRFATHAPFPTVARDHPEFGDGYWRGLVWLDQAHFAIEGLRRYGYDEDADAFTQQVLQNLEGVTEPGVPLRENYHPLTGEGRNVKHFSWTAAHLLMMILESR